jgi:hypothetical protein
MSEQAGNPYPEVEYRAGMARTSGPSGVDHSLIHELVGSPQRRELVWHLVDSGGDATFEAVVDALADGPERDMTAIRIHHVHLPKLQSTGVVDWEVDTGTIRLTSRARRTLAAVDGNGLLGRTVGD